MANWGDITGSWQFIVDTVRYVELIIQLNILTLVAGALTFIFYEVLEISGLALVLGTRTVIVSILNLKKKTLSGFSMNERMLYNAVHAQGNEGLHALWDIRIYWIRFYRVWQYSITILVVGLFWIGLIFLFLNALTQGSVMVGDMTLLEYSTEILSNTGVMIVFAMSVVSIFAIVTALLISWRIFSYFVLQEKLIGEQTMWQVIKQEVRPLFK